MDLKTANLSYHQLSFDQNETPNTYGAINFYHCPYNCKLTVVTYSNCIFSGIKKEKIFKMNELLKKSRILVYINTNQEVYKDFLEENYEIYESIKVPIGYYGGYQYHVFIRNDKGIPNINIRPTEFIKKIIQKSKTK